MTSIEIRTQNMYDQLSKAEKLAADYLLHNLDHIFRYPLATLAQRSGTSQGAWVRFCKSIGYDGIKDLKNSLFKEMQESASDNSSVSEYDFSDIKQYKTLSDMAKRVCVSSTLAIEDTLTLFQEKQLKTAINRIKKSGRVAIFGMHASGIVANDLYDKLLRIGYPALYSPDYHVSLTIAATLTSEDVAIFISYSGDTPEMLHLCQLASRRKAYTIAITRPVGNPLTENASLSLSVNSPQTDRRIGAMSSRIAQLIMTDILFTGIVMQDYAKVEPCLEQTFEACHPEGLPDVSTYFPT